MTTAIIIDDEPMARQLLKGMLQEHCPHVEIVDLCANLSEGVKSIHKNRPNIVFLDIEMPGHSGLELLDFFNPNDIDFSIIFTTAYNQYAVKAFKLSAIDYLLKPIDAASLIDSMERYSVSLSNKMDYSILKENLSVSNQLKKLAVHTVNSIDFLELNTICFMKAEGAYTRIILKDGSKIISSRSLKYFEQTLEELSNFTRCHKSYIVNVNEITKYVKTDGGSLIINDSDKISIAQEKVKEILELLNI